MLGVRLHERERRRQRLAQLGRELAPGQPIHDGTIFVQVGNALELVKKTPGKFDFIFNDVDKHQYPDALRAAVPKLKRGGLFVTDNTLWSGKAARAATPEDKDTRGVQEFNRLVYASKQLFPVLIPLRDGVTVCRKL